MEENNHPQPRRGPGIGLTVLQSFVISGCVSLLVPVLMFIGLFGLLYYALSSAVRESSGTMESFSLDSIGPSADLREKVLRPGADGSGVMALITIHGAIDGDGSPLEGDGMMARVSEELRNAADDGEVKAILLQIDSPGGGLTASDMIHDEVLKAKAKGKKVLAWGSGLMASGGYYIAVGADGIMASPTATVGSIGVIMRHFQVSELMRKLGVKSDAIVSGDRKDMGSPFRDMTPDERAFLQEFIDSAHSRFVDIVAQGRNLPEEQVRALADGGVFTAQKALEQQLIDRIGYVDDAVAWLEEMTGESDMKIITYRRLPSFLDIFREAGKGVSGGIVESAREEPAARTMAVWQ